MNKTQREIKGISCKAFWGFLVLIWCLTRRQFDLQGRADEGHQGGGEVDRVVVRDGHVHLHQSLKRVKAERRSHEVITTNQKIRKKKLSSLKFPKSNNWLFGWTVCVCAVYIWQCFCLSNAIPHGWLLLCCYNVFICWRLEYELAWNDSVDKLHSHCLKTLVFAPKWMI